MREDERNRAVSVLAENLRLLREREGELEAWTLGQFREGIALCATNTQSPSREAAALYGSLCGEAAPLCSVSFARFCKAYAEAFPRRVTARAYWSRYDGGREGSGSETGDGNDWREENWEEDAMPDNGRSDNGRYGNSRSIEERDGEGGLPSGKSVRGARETGAMTAQSRLFESQAEGERGTAPELDSPVSVAYPQNAFTECAYRFFSGKEKGMRAVAVSGYAAACEEVYYGRCGCAILPLIHSADGILVSFLRMLRRYDLKIASVCALEMDEETTVRYVLAKKGLALPGGAKESGAELLDMAVVLPDETPAADFLAACQVFGGRTLLLHSLPVDSALDSDPHWELNVELSVKDADLSALALFLEASHLRFQIDGIYRLNEV